MEEVSVRLHTRILRILSLAAPALLAACASAPVGAPVAAPRLIVGDHWQYRVIDNMRRGAISQLDAEVVGVAGGVATLKFVRVDDDGRRTEWADEIDGGGGLRAGILGDVGPRRFSPAASLFAFPLEQGKTWRQTVPTLRSDTGLRDAILVYGDVKGRAQVSVPAGSFDAVHIYRVLDLDDGQPWRTRTTRRDQIWYAPEVKGAVREAREATYAEPGDSGATQVYTERTVTELVAFRPGRA
jgi:hypothetical protein